MYIARHCSCDLGLGSTAHTAMTTRPRMTPAIAHPLISFGSCQCLMLQKANQAVSHWNARTRMYGFHRCDSNWPSSLHGVAPMKSTASEFRARDALFWTGTTRIACCDANETSQYMLMMPDATAASPCAANRPR